MIRSLKTISVTYQHTKLFFFSQAKRETLFQRPLIFYDILIRPHSACYEFQNKIGGQPGLGWAGFESKTNYDGWKIVVVRWFMYILKIYFLILIYIYIFATTALTTSVPLLDCPFNIVRSPIPLSIECTLKYCFVHMSFKIK